MKKKFQKVRLVCTSDTNENWRDDDDLLNQRCLDRLTTESKKLRTINDAVEGKSNRRIFLKNFKKDQQKFVVPLITKFKATQARVTPQQRFLPNLSTQPASLYQFSVKESRTPVVGKDIRTPASHDIRTPESIHGPCSDVERGPTFFNSDQRPMTPSIDQQISKEIRELTQTMPYKSDNGRFSESKAIIATSRSKASHIDYYSLIKYPRRLNPTPFAKTFDNTNPSDSIKKMALKLYATSNTPLKPLNPIKKNNFLFEKRYSRENWSPGSHSRHGPTLSNQEPTDQDSSNQIMETVSMEQNKVSRIQRLVQKIPGPQIEMNFD